MNFELKMPDLSTTDSPMKVVGWLIAVGESVERGQAVLNSLRFLKMPIAQVCGMSSKRCENWFGRSLTLPEAASRLTLLRK
jgi:hypothetical protein